MVTNKDIHLPTSFQAPSSKPNATILTKATIALNQTRENLSPKLIPKLHHQKPNTTNPTPPSLMTPKKQIPSSQLVM
jgi:hypothetical protein